jgi:hypothetical protein
MYHCVVPCRCLSADALLNTSAVPPEVYCALLCCAARLRGSKDGLAGQVLQDLVVGGSVVQRPGVAPSTLMVPERVRATELPQFCPQAYAQYEAVDRGMYADFSALQPQPYKVRWCTIATEVCLVGGFGQSYAQWCLPDCTALGMHDYKQQTQHATGSIHTPHDYVGRQLVGDVNCCTDMYNWCQCAC